MVCARGLREEAPPTTTRRAVALPGAQGAPTLSLYLLEADFRGPADPDGPRPCFRSCMLTSWLAGRGQQQCFGIQGVSPGAPPCPPVHSRGALASSARMFPGDIAPPPAVHVPTVLSMGTSAFGPGPQGEPDSLTRLFDSDGEAVVVGAPFGLHRHVAGGITCTRGRARQVRVRTQPLLADSLASRDRCTGVHGGQLPKKGLE